MADGSVDLFSKFTIRHSASEDLYAKFYVGQEWGPYGCQRKTITITERSGGAYTDYPTMVVVAYAEGMSTDFSNVRFTEWDSVTAIPFGLITKVDGVSATFVLKRTYKRATKNYIWVYYGRPQASGAVAYTTWLEDWYKNNGFGPSTTGYTDTTCANYPRTANGTVPAWVEHVVAGISGVAGVVWGYAAFTGRMKINGIAKPWASTIVCNGIVTRSFDHWDYASLNSNTYDDAAFVKGANNVTTWGHYSAGNNAVRVAWWPKEPTITFRAEEEQSGTGDVFADLIVRNSATKDLKATFDVGQDSESLFAELVVRNADTRDLYARFEVQYFKSLFAKFTVRHDASEDLFVDLVVRNADAADLFAEFELQKSEDLFAEFTVRQDASEDLYVDLVVRNADAADLFAEFELQKSEDLFAEFTVRQDGQEELKAIFDVGQGSGQIFSKMVVKHTATPLEIFAEFVVRHTSTCDMPAQFEVGQGWENLRNLMLINGIGYIVRGEHAF